MTLQRPLILVGCDGSPQSELALGWAADHALRTGGQLHLLAAWEWPTFQGAPITYGRWGPDHDRAVLLDRLRAGLSLPEDRVTVEVVHGHPAHTLVERAHDSDLLVVGTHGMNAVSRLVLGSVSSYCATHSPAPVAIVRRHEPRAHGVLVGVDDSVCARAALRWAMDYADLVNERLRVVNVVESVSAVTPGLEPLVFEPALHRECRRWLREVVAKEEADRGRGVAAGVTRRVLDGSPPHVLLEQSRRSSITVVGRRGAGGMHRLVVGSVAAALAHNARATVVLTPSP